MGFAAPSPRLIPKGENRETLARLVRYLIQGQCVKGALWTSRKSIRFGGFPIR